MANDDRQSEQFIREVDEELRRAQLKSIWDRFAPLIIGACVLVVAVTAGYRGWLWWQERQASTAGDQFLSALELAQSGDTAGSDAALRDIAADSGTGYAALARLRLAGEQAVSGDKAEAIAAFDQIAADGSISESLRSLARLRAALLALDTGDLDGARARAEPLNASGNVWRHPAREVLGTAAYHAGDLEAARGYFTQIQEDAETPPELWVRAGWMVALIDGQGSGPASPDSAAPAPDAAPLPPDQAAPAEPPAADAEAETPAQLPLSQGELPVPSGDLPVPSGELPVMPDEPATGNELQTPADEQEVPEEAAPETQPPTPPPAPAAPAPPPIPAPAPAPAAPMPSPAPASPSPAPAAPTPTQIPPQ